MEILNRVQKFSILGPQNLGWGGGRLPDLRGLPWIRTCHELFVLKILFPTVIYERCQLVEGLDGELTPLKKFWRRIRLKHTDFNAFEKNLGDKESKSKYPVL